MYLYIGGMPSNHIEVWSVDPQRGATSRVQTVGDLESPSFLVTHPRLPVLYVAERRWTADDDSTGALTTYRIDPSAGTLQRVARCRSGGASTAHVNVTPDCRYVSTANPLGPTTALFRLDEAGTPGNACTVVRHEGRGALERQSAPWPHSSYADNASRTLFVCDLGLDRIMIYDIDADKDTLSPATQSFAQVSSGAGARHMALSADSRFAYVANELDSTISVFGFDATRERLSIVQTISTIPESFVNENLPAEIVLGRDGRFLYVTNRGHDTVGVFNVDLESGKLAAARFAPALGESPRHIVLSAEGKLAAVSNQASHRINLFIVAANGMLEDARTTIPFENPTCCAFLRYG